jgi:peptidoglycan/xylan/chitin deacetylase (PgdA/CDA1 family)
MVMGGPLTIVMYHYVRDLARSRFPRIKGLDAADFTEQVGYIRSHYSVISGQQLVDAVSSGSPLPERPLLLTFDDGYTDHFDHVLRVLERERMTACFFPPGKCILEHKVLDVNKIHFILAAAPDIAILVDRINSFVDTKRADHQLPSPAEYWAGVAKPSRWDSADVVYCKRMLQRELPHFLRQDLVDRLFAEFVTSDEAAFAEELYMSPEQIVELRERGMFVGSHSYDHFWLNRLSPGEQESEIDRSLEFLASVGAPTTDWIMCYPYGGYDESLLSILRKRSCSVGLTTVVGLASLGTDDPLTLPRIDTNDLPLRADAPANDWTAKAGTASA